MFQEQLVTEISKNRVDTLSQISHNIEKIQDEIITISDMFYNNQEMQEIILNFNASSHEDELEIITQLDNTIRTTLMHYSFTYEMQLFTTDGLIYSSNSENVEIISTYVEKSWYYKASADSNETNLYWLSHLPIDEEYSNDIDYISLVRFIYNDIGDFVGCLMINVPEETLCNTYISLIDDYNSIYIVDADGRIVSHSTSSMVGRLFYNMEVFNDLFADNDYATIYKSGESYLFSRYISTENNWIVVEEIPMDEVLSPLISIRNSIILISILVFICCIFLSSLLAWKVSKPLTKVYDAMKQAQEGDFNVAFPQSGFAETRWISSACENFIIRIVELLNAIKKEERQKRITELKFRQMQINPHFMHNTLFTIKCMIDMNRNDEACKMLDAFNEMLQDTLESNDLLVTVEQEIHTLQQYGYLLQQRYGSSFQIEYHISPECNDLLILRFILQPIMENSIFHGLAHRSQEGLVTIDISCNSYFIFLRVSDNGCGMSEEKLNTILNSNATSGQHIGVNNVHSRLKLHYGENANFIINSTENVGTTVFITVPRYNIPDNSISQEDNEEVQ
ncbi:MAG: histidine kinase [Eubacteriales bacterium]